MKPPTASSSLAPRAPDPRARWRLLWTDRLGRAECPYIRRWVLDLGPLGSLRVHHWYADDDQRAHHDHPWGFLTLCIAGSYTDISRTAQSVARCDILRFGSLRWRPAEYAHTVQTTGAWTLLWTQPKRRSFGFYVPRGNTFRWMKHTRFFPTYGLPACDDRHSN